MISKNTIIFPAVLMLLALVSVTSAQMIEVNAASVNVKVGEARQKFETMNHRSTMVGEVYEGRRGPRTSRNTLIKEVFLPDRVRQLQINETPQSTSKTESVSIGNEHYRRFNEGEWSKVLLTEQRKYDVYGDPPDRSKTTIRFESKAESIKNADLDGREVSFFQIYRKTFVTRDEVETVQITMERYWFDTKDRLVKEVREMELEGQSRYILNSTTYEYDESIRIEAPIQ